MDKELEEYWLCMLMYQWFNNWLFFKMKDNPHSTLEIGSWSLLWKVRV